MPFFPDVDEELNQIEASKLRTSRSTFDFGDPRLAGRVNGYADLYPWLDPTVIHALAGGGVDPSSRTARLAAEAGVRNSLDALSFDTGRSVRAGSVSARGGGAFDFTALDRLYARPAAAQPETMTRLPEEPDELLSALAESEYFDAEKGILVAPRAGLIRFREELSRLEDRFQDQLGLGIPYLNQNGRLAYVRSGGRFGALVPDEVDEDAVLHPYEQAVVDAAKEMPDFDRSGGGGGGFLVAGPDLSGINRAVQTNFMVLNAPLQELQGQFRNVVGAVRGENVNFLESQSDLGVVLGGDATNAGSGYFVDPESDVGQERLRREQARGLIGGHVITPGRLLADAVTEPGTKPFNLLSGMVDFGVATVADPSNIVLGKIGKAAEANRLFTEAGGLLGLRRTVDPTAVTRWLDGSDGRRVVQAIADTPATYDVWNGLGRNVDPGIAARLADTTTPDDVANILRPLLGVDIRHKPDPSSFSPVAARSTRQVRLLNTMPGPFVDVEDPVQAVTQVERFLRNVKAPNELVYSTVDRMARATDRVERFAALEEMMGSAKGLLATKYKLPASRARSLTTMFRNSTEDARKFFVDEIGNTESPWNRSVMINGEAVDLPSPHLLVEHIDRLVPLPDARDLRRATSRFRRLLDNPAIDWPVSLLQSVQDQIWKPAALLRAAWPVRVIAEEQIRMATAGLDSMFRHPISALAWALGHKGSATALGESWDDVEKLRLALTRGSGGWRNRPGIVSTPHWQLATKGEDGFVSGWAGELAQLHADPVARRVAQWDDLQAAKDWFWHAGSEWRETLAKAGREGHSELLTRQGADDYIESVSRRISVKTGGNGDLLDAVKTGKLNGNPITVAGDTRLERSFVTDLEAHLDSAPQKVKAQTTIIMNKGSKVAERYDRAVEWMFGQLMSRNTNWLSRSPTFKQQYWRRVGELMSFADIDAQQKILRAAEKAGITGRALKDLKAARHTTGGLALDELDDVAKGFALDETRNLLYDMSQRSQFFDMTRLLFPFGEAWKEIVTRWFGKSGLIVRNPRAIRRGQQLIQGARGEDLGELVGAPEGEGFFYTNTQGEEVFVYPGSQWLTSKMIGVPVPLVGRVSGLNLVGEVWPALGPMAQIPAGWFLPDSPAWDDVREVLLPFGEFDSPEDITSWAPPWLQRLANSEGGNDPEATRLWANTTMDVARYLASTGEYDLSSQEGIQKMLEDAKSKARQFYIIRGVVAFGAPSAPSPEWQIKDKDGNLINAAILGNEFRALQEEDPSTAVQKFLDTYGTEPLLLMQAKTHAVVFSSPTTEEGLTWVRANPSVQEDFPNVYGYFAPQGGEFSYNAYLRSIQSGDRQPLSPEQFVKLGNARIAALKYNQARDQIAEMNEGGAPTDAQRSWLRQLKDALIRDYPGYSEALGLGERATPEQLVRELESASQNATVAATDAGQGLASYLRGREQAQAEAERRGLAGFQQAQAARDVRDWLRTLADAVIREHPDFAPLYENVFSREMNEDLEYGEQAA